MRLFVALDIDDPIRQSIAGFMQGVRAFAPDARWVRPESLHVTLKFIGERPAEEIASVRESLSGIKTSSFTLGFRDYGFFPTPKSPRVFWIGIEADPALSQLASLIDDSTAKLGIAKEAHAYSPHLTLARGGQSGSPRWPKGEKPNSVFRRLQEKLSALAKPDFGTMSAREFYLFDSKLGPGGAIYKKLERFPLESRT